MGARHEGRTIRGFLCALVLLASGGCGVWSSAPASLESESYQLTSHEAACLVAELLALQFSAVNPDQGRPRAYAMDLGGGDYRILYVRGDQGLFLPEGNGVFVRDRFLGPDEVPFLQDPPHKTLGRIWFKHMRTVSPWLGGSESLRVEVRSTGATSCRVQIESRSLLERQRETRIQRIGYVLDCAERLGRGLRHYRAGDRKHAFRELRRLCELHDEGLSAIHDTMLAQAHALCGLILQSWERGEDARAELSLARMRAPASHELALAWADLMEDLGRPGDALETMLESAASCSPGSRAEVILRRKARTQQRESKEAGSYSRCLAKAKDLMRGGRHWAAKNWAERARDLRPRGVEAQRVLARTLDGLGRHREARDLRLLSLHGRVPDAEVVLALVENERQLGHPELALRWILRHAELLKDSPEARRGAESLIALLGTEESLRLMRSEGRFEATLPLILEWMQSQPGPRAELLCTILSVEMVRHRREQQAREQLTAQPIPMRALPGASGLVERSETGLVAPGK